MPGAGSLTVVGTGIRAAAQITTESRMAVEQADVVLYVAVEPLTVAWLRRANALCESLLDLYADGKDRRRTYEQMVERALALVREGKAVCMAFYGHPGVFAYPGHEAIRQARREGFPARMLPGISAEDCLFADLGADPATHGCQSFEATDFLIYKRRFDPRSALILWQIDGLGQTGGVVRPPQPEHLRVLTRYLAPSYPPDQQAVLYVAAQYPLTGPILTRLTLPALPEATIPRMATLYIPPIPATELDREMLRALNIPEEATRALR